MPAVIRADRELSATRHPLLDALLSTLAEWRPGALRSERAYHERLFHLLRRRHASLHVGSERRVPDGYGSFRRVDLVLEGFGESLLVEVKAKYSRGDCDRAAQQLRAYVDLKRGPVALVLCDADEEVPRFRELLGHVQAQRDAGLPVFAAVATNTGPSRVLAGQTSSPSRAAAKGQKPTLQVALVAAVLVSVPCAYWYAHPPRGLLPRPTAHRPARVATVRPPPAPAVVTPAAIVEPRSCTAEAATAFHLRPRVTTASVGPEYPAGTAMRVLSRTDLVRRGNRLYRVSLVEGPTGYVFLSANEFVGRCDL